MTNYLPQDPETKHPWTDNDAWADNTATKVGICFMAAAAAGSFLLTGHVLDGINEANTRNVVATTTAYIQATGQTTGFISQQPAGCRSLLLAYQKELATEPSTSIPDMASSGICGPNGLAIIKTAANNAMSSLEARAAMEHAKDHISSRKDNIILKMFFGGLGGCLFYVAANGITYDVLDSHIRRKENPPYDFDQKISCEYGGPSTQSQ